MGTIFELDELFTDTDTILFKAKSYEDTPNAELDDEGIHLLNFRKQVLGKYEATLNKVTYAVDASIGKLLLNFISDTYLQKEDTASEFLDKNNEFQLVVELLN
jgi:hypothetical protein